MLDLRLTVNPNLMEKPNTKKASDIQMTERGIRSLRSAKLSIFKTLVVSRYESTHNSDDYIWRRAISVKSLWRHQL